MISRICHLLKMKQPEMNRGLLFASGSTVPEDGTDGYQTGCIFQHTDGIKGETVYINNGSVTACDFSNPEGGDTLTLAELADVADGFATRILETGTYASTADSGVVLSATNQRPFSLLADDGGVTFAAGSVLRGALSRVLLSVDQTSGATINSVRGQIKANNLVDITSADAVTAPVSGYLELDGAGARTLNGYVACVRAALETGAGAHTIGTSVAGFEATLHSSGTFVGSGFTAAFLADIHGGTSKWQYGLYVEGGSVLTAGLQLGSDGSSAGDLIVYGADSGSYMQYDEDANTNAGRLNLLMSTLRTTMNRSYNTVAACPRMYYDISAENSSCRNVLAETTINTLVSVTGTSYHEINGINGEVILTAGSIINGTGLCISGVKGEIRGTGTQTACDFLCCVEAKYNNATELGTGDSALFLGWSHAGVVDYGLKLQVSDSGSLATGISLPACTGHLIEAATTSTWGTGITGAAIAIGDYSNPVAFGEVSDHVVGLCVNLSGSTDDTSNFIPIHGKFVTTADCTADAGAQAIYGRIDIAHNLSGSYAVRGAITMTGAPEVNQVYGMFSTMALAGCNLAETGQVAGLAIELTGSEDITQTGDDDYGKVSGIRIAWEHTNAMTLDTCAIYASVKSGATLDSGYRINAAGSLTNSFHSYNASGTPTNVVQVEGAHTNLFALPADGTAPVAAGNYEVHGGTKVRISVTVGGQQYYMLASTAPTTQS